VGPGAESGRHTEPVDAARRQGAHRVRFEWGAAGAAAVATDGDLVVVIDVLSFTTTLSVAVDAGVAVLPCSCDDDAAAEALAHDHGAVLAVGRSQGRPGRFSLSPASIRAAVALPKRLVLPSPNGSELARSLVGGAATCVGACLRNAPAVAAWITHRHRPEFTTVAVIAAGERWDDGTLRPAVEDLWGAGAVVSALADAGWRARSPEADLAVGANEAVRGRELEALTACASGRELIERGYAADVAIAAETDRSLEVPVLVDGAFVPASRTA
jgi:2-phosphosulfolactate phosphatase